MSCCAPNAERVLCVEATLPTPDELSLAARPLGDGSRQLELSVPGVHCAACIGTVEKALLRLDHVTSARVNLSTKRVTIQWQGPDLPPIVQSLASLGYVPHLFSPDNGRDQVLSELIQAVAISGFAAANIMLLSVSVWSGAEGSTRDLFHWISALIAIPALIFAGRIYYRSAWNALRHGRMNMDVPIAVGITLAYAMSLYETVVHGPHAYFDASVSLLFFLLIGRTLDHVMRERARSAVTGLARLAPRGALLLEADGRHSYRPVEDIVAGSRLLIAAGERIPVDVVVEAGHSDIDASIATGESAPHPIGVGEELRAGVLNLTGPLTVRAVRPASDSFLAEMTRLMEAAEGGRGRYRRLAERVSSLYAPVVHLTALLTLLGWIAMTGDWHRATTIAIAVLIITCPCALGLAVPIVQVVAARRLFEQGVMMRDGAALERLVEVDTVAFDKTGTLTRGTLQVSNAETLDRDAVSVASALAAYSRHPAAQAITGLRRAGEVQVENVEEIPGYGIEARINGKTWRLGRGSWAAPESGIEGTLLAEQGVVKAVFEFSDTLRPEAETTVSELARLGMNVEMLSGDTVDKCASVAGQLGIRHVLAGLLPAQKIARIAELSSQGRKVLMVGDGLNDAPALAAASVSMAPATAADIGRNAADFVFLHNGLSAVTLAISVAKKADRLVRQNIALAVVYNFVAVPIAISGYVTPLIAAVAMSASSLLVIANALRLTGWKSSVAWAGRNERGEALA
ncbi:heavy metal translocating P-type ATPase [Mesorhizobium sp. KR9-304]|uniref:heavy metal translocating P-type ATPase n=1 Tax=Mesorhizobium sp. KR9-304 TaxID=3156614 RepID=UPI0032B4194C